MKLERAKISVAALGREVQGLRGMVGEGETRRDGDGVVKMEVEE